MNIVPLVSTLWLSLADKTKLELGAGVSYFAAPQPAIVTAKAIAIA